MKESIKNYMRVGVIHFMAYPDTMKGEGPVLESLGKILKDDYFDAVEMTWIKDKTVRRRAIQMMEQAHITVCYGSQPRMLTTGMNINDLDPVRRAAALASLKAGIDDAYDYGAAGFAYLSGKYDPARFDACYEALLDSTRQLCAYAKSKGDLPVLLEIFDYDVDKKSIIGPADLAARFAADVCTEFDNFGLMNDLSHIPQTHESPSRALLPIQPWLRHIHIGNAVVSDPKAPAYGDAHPRFGFPNGANDVEELVEYLRTIFQIGYLGKGKRPIVSFEVKPWQDEDPDVVLAGAKRTLNEAWVKLEI